MSTLGVHDIKQHEEFYLHDGNVCFLVENTLFRLHRYFFERESDYFRAWLKPPTRDEDRLPGSPYIITDAKSDEFAQFVWVWYNREYSFVEQDKEKWLTIIRLATQWRFHNVRNLAIRHLEEMKFKPVEKIAIYTEYSVDKELLLPSYVSLCRSPTLPSPEEGKILTMETVLKLARAREQVLHSASERGYKTPTTAGVPDDVVNTIVADLFGLTRHSNDQTVRMEGQAMNNGNVQSDKSVNPEVVTVKHPNPNMKGKMSGNVSQEPSQSGVGTASVGGSAGKGKYKP